MRKILKDLEFKVTGDLKLKVQVPTFRPDIEREVDLIEEVARIEGYDKIPDSIENIGPLFTPVGDSDKFKSELRQLLTGVGFDEIIGHGLTDSRLGKLLNPELAQLKIQNPVSAELDVMRNSLCPFALNVVQHNLNFRTMDLRLFEIGKIFFPPDAKGHWMEEERLLLLVTGATAATWRDQPRQLDYYDITGAVSQLAEHFHWPPIEYKKAPINCFDKELSFGIFCGNAQIGQIGLLAKSIADKLDLKQKVYLAEMTLSNLIENSKPLIEFRPLPIYPSAPRDLAIVVNESVKAAEIVAIVKEAAGLLAENVSIFDLYQGKQIEAGKKSLAVSITYRSTEGSLSAEQVERQQQVVINQLKHKLNAEIRDK
jgi:phenylalanyl-tRNA synthetase beta chain